MSTTQEERMMPTITTRATAPAGDVGVYSFVVVEAPRERIVAELRARLAHLGG